MTLTAATQLALTQVASFQLDQHAQAVSAGTVVGNIGSSLREAFFMFWETLWALIVGFALSGAVQAFVPREALRAKLGNRRPAAVARASVVGALSSSCSYAASAMAKSLFAKGADFVTSMIFMFASTNLVVELGLVLVVLIGWEFVAAEYVGGVIMIVLLALLGGVFLSGRAVSDARAKLDADHDQGTGHEHRTGHEQGAPTDHGHSAHDHGSHDHGAHDHGEQEPAAHGHEAHGHEAQGHEAHSHEAHSHEAHGGHEAHGTGEQSTQPWQRAIRTKAGWADAATYTVADLTMLRREMIIGFGIAGFIAVLVPNSFWHTFFITGHGIWTSIENAIVGPFIALISFVCSIGNVPLAAALWKGGISFGGVVSFIFADLIALPLVLIYRKFYGTRLALRMLAVFWAVMAAAGLATELIFSGAGLIPTRRPVQIVPEHLTWNYTTILNIIFLAIFGVLFFLYRNRSKYGGGDGYAIDPVCGMQVEKSAAPRQVSIEGQTYWFCSDRCCDRFDASPARFSDASPAR
ncbi:MAG TPA: permease [Streptosporangiaceae bacterium]|nr:permease [Streptosporangiaceae bacterium]